MRSIEDWTNELVAVFPPIEMVVTTGYVTTDDGFFVALSALEEPLGDSNEMQIVWLHRCNDQPTVDQRWLVRVLGYDIPSKTWISQALIRVS